MARLLEGVSKSAQREIGLNNALSDKIVRVLCKNGVVLCGAEVTEGDLTQIILTGIDISRTSCNENRIKELLENELKLSLSKPILEVSGGYAIMKLEAVNQRKIDVQQSLKDNQIVQLKFGDEDRYEKLTLFT